MELFCEHMVKCEKTAKQKAITVWSIAGGVLLTLLAVMFLLTFLGALTVLIVAGIWYGVSYLVRGTNIEYEYILTGNMMDVDKIMSQKMRKRVVKNLDIKEILCCAPVNENITSGAGIKVSDYSGNSSCGSDYYMDYMKNGEKNRMLFSPNSKMLEIIKHENPRALTVNDGDLG